MLVARTQIVFAVAAAALLFAQAHARADYMSQTVPLISQQFGVTGGAAIGESNNGTTAMNGLLPGQVRLTFTAEPLTVYTQNGPGLGFTGLEFATNLNISQITLPAGWEAMPAPGSPGQLFTFWNVSRNTPAPGGPSVPITISGLGSLATLNHFLTPSFLGGGLVYPGASGAPVADGLFATTMSSAPEPSTLAIAAAGLLGVVIGRRVRAGRQGRTGRHRCDKGQE